MDIEEIKKLAREKIKAEALSKQVRNRMRTTIWEKQNLREGFTETFEPLIESQDNVKKVLINSKMQ